MKTTQLLIGATSAFLALLAQTGYAQLNYFAGDNAGKSNTTGSANTFVGPFAGFLNATGSDNVFLGRSSGFLNISSSKNTFVGSFSGFSQVKSFAGENTFVGYRSGYSNNDGFFNSFFGTRAGEKNTTGNFNVFLGTGTGGANTIGSGNTFVGWAAGGSNIAAKSNTFFGNVAGLYHETGDDNAYFGAGAGHNNKTGSENTFVGNEAGYKNTTGSNNTLLGYAAESPENVTLTNATAIGNRSYVSASNALVLGSINGVNKATANTNVGIGVHAPTYQLQLSTDKAAKPGSSTWTIASDERLKKNVEAYTDGLELVRQIEPVRYQYTGEAGMPTNQTFIGVIAQRMQRIAPYTVGTFTHQDTLGKRTDYLDYNAGALTYALVNAVKEQQQQIEQKEAAIQAIRTDNENLRRELTEIRVLLERGNVSGPPKASGEPTEGADGTALWQNQPNPTDGSTVIRYRVPQAAGRAQIKLFSVTGQQLHTFELTRGRGQVTVPAKLLPAGTYVYHLLVDGQRRESRKLVQIR